MRIRALVLVLAAAVMSAALLGSASANTRSPFPEGKLDLMSAPPVPDFQELEASSSSGGSGSTGSGPPPRVGPNIQVNAPQMPLPNGLIGRSETTLTAHGQNMIAGWNDAQGFCGPPFNSACPQQVPHGLSGYAFSTDGGETWTDGGGPDPFGSVLSRGDPWMDDDGGQTWYYANLAVHPTTAASLGVGVWRGHFSGNTFQWDDVKSFDSPHNNTLCDDPTDTTPPINQIPCDFYDKEALVAGKGTNKDDAYVSLTNFQGQKFIGPPPGCGTLGQFGFGQIEVWRTHDGGSTWQGPAIAGPEAADSVASCGNAGTLQQASVPAIGPNGEVYVVWQFGPTFTAAFPSGGPDADIVFARSTDGGATFSAPKKLADINAMRANNPLAFNRTRIIDHPRIEVALAGKNKGRIYVTYYSAVSPVIAAGAVPCPAGVPVPPNTCFPQSLVSSKVFVTHSDDKGNTWSTPQEIGGPLPTGPNIASVKRWWPDVTVGPGGEVHIVYYEERDTNVTPDASDVECNTSIATNQRRFGTHSALVDTWWTFSQDGGTSWSTPLKLSDETTNWCFAASNIRPNMGDYIDAEAGAGLKVYGFWADARVTGNGFVPGPAFFPFNMYFANSVFAAGKS
jgi:hypothetical protein